MEQKILDAFKGFGKYFTMYFSDARTVSWRATSEGIPSDKIELGEFGSSEKEYISPYDIHEAFFDDSDGCVLRLVGAKGKILFEGEFHGIGGADFAAFLFERFNGYLTAYKRFNLGK